MGHGRFLRIGGYVSGGLLMAFGIVVIALGIWGFTFARDHIEREGITFGPASDPAVQEHAEQWADEPVDTGRKALAMAEIMREHTLAATGGLTYSQMGRFQSADDPSDQAGTNDEAEAAKDANGQPVSNGARDIWVLDRVAHTIGTCRMGHDGDHAVVDAFGKSFEVPNLWVCDGSTFPSSLAANPALTIMALSLRSAEKVLSGA